MKRQFRRDIDSLSEIFEFVEEYFAANGIDPSNSFWVDLVLEELFTNIVKYSDGIRDVIVQIDSVADDKLMIQLTDFGARKFDITESPEVDSTLPLARRKVGGLGLHFVKEIADTISYEYKNRSSVVTVTKRLEG